MPPRPHHPPERRVPFHTASNAPTGTPLRLPPGGLRLTYPTADGPVTASVTLLSPADRAAWPHDPAPGRTVLVQQLSRGEAHVSAVRTLNAGGQPQPPSVILSAGPDILRGELSRHLRLLRHMLAPHN